MLNPWIGQVWMIDELNAYTMMIAIGTNRNSSTPATQMRSPIRASRPSITASPSQCFHHRDSNAPSSRAPSR